MGKSIIEKIWDRHIVNEEENKPDLIYIDLQYIHEVTSPQAFEGLRLKGRKVRRPDSGFCFSYGFHCQFQTGSDCTYQTYFNDVYGWYASSCI